MENSRLNPRKKDITWKLIISMRFLFGWLPVTWLLLCFSACKPCFLFAFSSQVDLKWFMYSNFPTDMELGENEYAKPEANEVGSYSITCIPRCRQKYEYFIERSQSPFRWIEYSLSSPLMKMHIAQVAGVTDIHLLFMIFAAAHSVLYFAMLHERINAKARADGYDQIWWPFFLGFVPHMACWSVIFCYFFTGLKRGDPPAFVSIIVFTLFALDQMFPLVFFLQWKQVGPFRDYLVGEFGCIMLSFTAKTFLAWVTLAGANAYTNN